VYRSDWEAVIDAAGSASLDHLNSLPDRRVYPQGSHTEIRAALDHPPTDTGIDAAQVVHELARDLGPYITAHASGRYFGFVIGGLHPASWGAEILVSSWDQNAGLFPPTPGVSVAEELAAQWLLDILDLPSGSSVGFVTGGQMATVTCLAAARHEVLRAVGWDVEADGLTGAPPITVVVKEDAHSTVLRALRLLGLGERAVITVPCDEQSNIRPDALEQALESSPSGRAQVLVRWLAPNGDNGGLADTVMSAVRAEGVAFFSGTTYRGERLMRISVSDWATDDDDVDRAIEALLRNAALATA
jgi:glutamate/tyrosine decarboxylase-like PLP-dependent enzyme